MIIFHPEHNSTCWSVLSDEVFYYCFFNIISYNKILRTLILIWKFRLGLHQSDINGWIYDTEEWNQIIINAAAAHGLFTCSCNYDDFDALVEKEMDNGIVWIIICKCDTAAGDIIVDHRNDLLYSSCLFVYFGCAFFVHWFIIFNYCLLHIFS